MIIPGAFDGGLCGVDGLEGQVADSGHSDHRGSEAETRSRADGGTEKRHVVERGLFIVEWGAMLLGKIRIRKGREREKNQVFVLAKVGRIGETGLGPMHEATGGAKPPLYS
jgi:hypothetical protein